MDEDKITLEWRIVQEFLRAHVGSKAMTESEELRIWEATAIDRASY